MSRFIVNIQPDYQTGVTVVYLTKPTDKADVSNEE